VEFIGNASLGSSLSKELEKFPPKSEILFFRRGKDL